MPQTIALGDPVEQLPFATRYLNCTSDIQGSCNDPSYRFNATCWINRTDFIPNKQQSSKPGSQVSWHPGNRA